MSRRRLALIAAVAVSVALVAAGLARSMGTTKLKGTTGPGFTISLTKGGKKVTSLKAGSYSFVISDKSSIHNFHLTGPGVNKSTSVGKTGTSTWTITVKKGT